MVDAAMLDVTQFLSSDAALPSPHAPSGGSSALHHCEDLREQLIKQGPAKNGSCVDIKPFSWCTSKLAHCATEGLQLRCPRMCQICNATRQQLHWEARHLHTSRTCGSVRAAPGTSCTHYFVDAGANTGDSLAEWYRQPTCWSATGVRYPLHLPLHPQCFYAWPPSLQIERRRQYCAVALEPNQRHWEALQGVAQEVRVSYGRNVTLRPDAFFIREGTARFGVDTVGKDGVGSSLELQRRTTDAGGRKGAGPRLSDQHAIREVPTIDAAALLEALGGVATAPNVVLKVDIEGSEYTVLRHLLRSGVLCRRVSHLFVEWHDTGENGEAHRWIRSQLSAPDTIQGPCKTRLMSWAR